MWARRSYCPGPIPNGLWSAQRDALGLPLEPAAVVALVHLRALLEERQRSREGHDRRDRGERDQHDGERAGRALATASPEADDHEHHDQPDDEVQPGRAGVREEHAEAEHEEQHRLGRSPGPEQARREDLLEHDQRCRDEEGPEHVRVLEQALGPTDPREQVVARKRHEQGERGDQRGDDRGRDVAAGDPAGDRRRGDVGGEPEPEARHVEGDREERDGPLRVGRTDSGDQVEREVRAHQQNGARDHSAQAEPARDRSDDDQHGEDHVRRRRLEANGREQDDGDGERDVVGHDRQPERAQDHDGEGDDDQRAGRMTVEEQRQRGGERGKCGSRSEQATGGPRRRRAEGRRELHQRTAAAGGRCGVPSP